MWVQHSQKHNLWICQCHMSIFQIVYSKRYLRKLLELFMLRHKIALGYMLKQYVYSDQNNGLNKKSRNSFDLVRKRMEEFAWQWIKFTQSICLLKAVNPFEDWTTREKKKCFNVVQIHIICNVWEFTPKMLGIFLFGHRFAQSQLKCWFYLVSCIQWSGRTYSSNAFRTMNCALAEKLLRHIGSNARLYVIWFVLEWYII